MKFRYMILKMHCNYDENTCSALIYFVQETRSSLLMTQLKRYVRQIPTSLMKYLAFTKSALRLFFLYRYIVSHKLVKQISIILFN